MQVWPDECCGVGMEACDLFPGFRSQRPNDNRGIMSGTWLTLCGCGGRGGALQVRLEVQGEMEMRVCMSGEVRDAWEEFCLTAQKHV